MGFEELTDVENQLFNYIAENDFENIKWSTAKAAEALGLDELTVYESLSNLSSKVRDNIYIHYKDGGIRISAER